MSSTDVQYTMSSAQCAVCNSVDEYVRLNNLLSPRSYAPGMFGLVLLFANSIEHVLY